MRILKVINIFLLLSALNMQADVKELTDKEQSDLDKAEFAVVKFYAEWCGPCKSFKPTFEEVEKDNSSKAKFYSVNVDNESNITAKYAIQSLPTVLILQKGKLVKKLGGDETKLRAELKDLKAPVAQVETLTKVETKKVKRSVDKVNTTTNKKKAKKNCESCSCNK